MEILPLNLDWVSTGYALVGQEEPEIWVRPSLYNHFMTPHHLPQSYHSECYYFLYNLRYIYPGRIDSLLL
jgi:hypothetical protein